jgi:hypothetical protein
MGHLTALAEDADTALATVTEARSLLSVAGTTASVSAPAADTDR